MCGRLKRALLSIIGQMIPWLLYFYLMLLVYLMIFVLQCSATFKSKFFVQYVSFQFTGLCTCSSLTICKYSLVFQFKFPRWWQCFWTGNRDSWNKRLLWKILWTMPRQWWPNFPNNSCSYEILANDGRQYWLQWNGVSWNKEKTMIFCWLFSDLVFESNLTLKW